MEQSRGLTGVLATLGLVSGVVAVFAGSFRVLPPDYQAHVLVSSAFLVSFGWIVYLRRRGTRGTAVVLVIASLLVVTAANWGR